MKPRVVCLIALLVGLAVPAMAEQNVPPSGFTALFNGRDLSGWYGWGTQDPTDLWKMTPEQRADYKQKSIDGGLVDGKGVDKGEQLKAHWRVEDGELVNDGKGLYLTTDKDYGDFELRVDYKMLPLGDSGIYLRGIPQVQIWDYTEEKKFSIGADKGSGGLWNNKSEEGKFPLKRMDKPFGEWNTFHIRMIGERVAVRLNGEVVVANAPLENFFANKNSKAAADAAKLPNGFMPDPAFPKGPIQLQTHGSEIRWRNVFVREIPADEANRELAGRAADGFVEYVGKDLGNWQGAVDSYEINDGAIVCKPGKGGDLLKKEPFENGPRRVTTESPCGRHSAATRLATGSNSRSLTAMATTKSRLRQASRASSPTSITAASTTASPPSTATSGPWASGISRRSTSTARRSRSRSTARRSSMSTSTPSTAARSSIRRRGSTAGRASSVSPATAIRCRSAASR